MKNCSVALILLFFCISAVPSFAVQTVFNVPSADVTEKGHVFTQQEAQFRGWNPDAFFNGTTYMDYGIGHNTEVGITVFNEGAPSLNNTALGIGFKSAMPIPVLKEKFPEREFKLTVGSMVVPSLQQSSVGNWTYAHVSGRVPKLNTRLTAGISAGTKQIFGIDTTSFIGAIEQPVTKKLTLLTDWFSGSEHFAGFLITGFSYALPKNTTVYCGYQIPNSPRVGVSGFVIELAKIF